MDSQEFKQTKDGKAPEEMLKDLMILLKDSTQFIVIGKGKIPGDENEGCFLIANCTEDIVPIITATFESKPGIRLLFQHAISFYKSRHGEDKLEEMFDLMRIAKNKTADRDIEKQINDLLRGGGKKPFTGQGGDA